MFGKIRGKTYFIYRDRMTNKIGIIGAGISGLTLGCILAKESLNCTIYEKSNGCLLYTSPSPRDRTRSRMPSSA